MKDFKEELYPESDKLFKDKEGYKAIILDEELDLIPVSFNGDGCAVLDVSKFEYITLSIYNLETLIAFIEQVEETSFDDDDDD